MDTLFLLTTPLFRGLTEDQLEELLTSSYVQQTTFEKGKEIFTQGEIPTSFFVLLQGSVQVETISEEGRRKILNRFNVPGVVFGEVYAYLSDPLYDYTCVVTEDAEILSIQTSVLNPKMNAVSMRDQLQYNMLQILSQKAYFLSSKTFILSEMTLRNKIIAYLNFRSKIKEGKAIFTREELADYLGTTRPSLSRELKKMEKDGLILLDKEKIFFSSSV